MFIQSCSNYVKKHYSIPERDTSYSAIASDVAKKMLNSLYMSVIASPCVIGLGIAGSTLGTLACLAVPLRGIAHAGLLAVKKLFAYSTQESFTTIAEETRLGTGIAADHLCSGLDHIAWGVSMATIGAFSLIAADPAQGAYRMARHACQQFNSSMNSILVPM